MAAGKKPAAKNMQAAAKIKAVRDRVVPTRTAFLGLVARANKSKNNPTSW